MNEMTTYYYFLDATHSVIMVVDLAVDPAVGDNVEGTYLTQIVCNLESATNIRDMLQETIDITYDIYISNYEELLAKYHELNDRTQPQINVSVNKKNKDIN